MKLATFRHQQRTSWGVIDGDGESVRDVGAQLSPMWPTLREMLCASGLDEVERVARAAREVALSDVELLPPIPEPKKILCVGVNYVAHREEMGRAEFPHPTLFSRFDSTLVGHEGALISPRVSRELDYEGELAVVIGKAGRHVSEADALSHVAGYACFNDATVRDWQRHSSQFTAGKNFPSTGAFGPWIVTADELGDPSALTLVTRVNGRELQRSTTDLLIFDIPKLLAYVSTFTELVPGDVISTGTPSGVGAKRTPPVFLAPGDVVEVEISRIGCLRNPVVQEP